MDDETNGPKNEISDTKNEISDNGIATEEEVAKMVESMTGFLRESEKILADAIPRGPMPTLLALTEIISKLQGCWDFVAGIVVPNCGNPNCTVHGTLATHAPTESELHDETGAGANTNEQPVSDSDHYYDDLDDDTD